MSAKIKWGIIGPGSIAHKFAKAIQNTSQNTVVAVASRSLDRANEFAAQYQIAKVYESYESLIVSKEVDAVYIATPHPWHFAPAAFALKNGVAVLCEKPITVNAKETAELIQLSKQNNVFLMEAMWTRCFPIMIEIKEILKKQLLGELVSANAKFCFAIKERNELSRLLNPDLAGGALLDVGVYLASISHYFFGKPIKVIGTAKIGKTTVDEDNEFEFIYNNGLKIKMASSVIRDEENSFEIYGTKGSLKIHNPFWRPEKYTLITEGNPKIKVFGNGGNGFEYEIDETARCLRLGLIESPIIKHQDSLEVIQILDTLRQQWNLKYPFES